MSLKDAGAFSHVPGFPGMPEQHYTAARAEHDRCNLKRGRLGSAWIIVWRAFGRGAVYFPSGTFDTEAAALAEAKRLADDDREAHELWTAAGRP